MNPLKEFNINDNQDHQEQSDSQFLNCVELNANKKKSTQTIKTQLSIPEKNSKDPNQYFNKKHTQFSGFENASEVFRSSKKSQRKLKLNSEDQIPSLNQQGIPSQKSSTITLVKNQKKLLNFKDSLLNKELQRPFIKDIEDIAKEDKDNCGSCHKKNQGGLSYKQRNKKLIKNFHQKISANQRDQAAQIIGKGLQQRNKQKQNHEANLQEKNAFQLNQYLFDQDKQAQKDDDSRIKRLMSIVPPNPESKFNFIVQKSLVEKQKELKIDGHMVYFPYQPYDAQVKYIGQVLKSLDKSQNAILESPTGTGKTLCLLSATLSWIQEQYLKSYKQINIVYLSRTHSQLAQVQKQLKKTCFRPTMAVFGSRELFCIKPQFKQLKGRQKVQACNKGVKLYLKYSKNQGRRRDLQFDQEQNQMMKPNQAQSSYSQKKLHQLPEEDQMNINATMCNYYAGERVVLQVARKNFKNKIITTEEIKQLGKKHNFCPYYYPTFIKPICNLFFMPYNYILDESLNSKYKQLISNSILIFDEAHNVPESSCEGRSYNINKRTFEDSIKQFDRLIKTTRMSQQLMMLKQKFQFSITKYKQFLEKILIRMINFIDDVQFPQQRNADDDSIVLKKTFRQIQTERCLYELLYERCYDHQAKIFTKSPSEPARRDLIKKMDDQITDQISSILELCQELKETPDGIFHNIEKVAVFLTKSMSLVRQSPTSFNWMQRQINHYRIMISKVDKSWEIDVICLVPFLTLSNIQRMEPRSIILTSGTLSPIQTWDSQLGIKFPIKFSNSHVIKPDQLMLRILPGQQKTQFNFSYKYLQQNFKTIYVETLTAISQLAQNIPNGMLVIVPSYKILSSIQRCMQFNPDIRKRLNKAKKYFTETKDSYEQLIARYRKAAKQPKGAILFCICRGKISEGIDFPDQLCRSVIFIGIPFPNIMDPILKQKKQHYDRISREESSYQFSGDKWYQNNTFRSVNQAIGRVIRHIYDFGTIFLLDQRYNFPKYKNQLSKWSSLSQKTQDLSPQLISTIHDFYIKMENNFGNYEGKNKVQSISESFQVQAYDQKEEKEQKQKYKVSNRQQKSSGFLIKKQGHAVQNKKKPDNVFQLIMGTNQSQRKKKQSFNANRANFM